jgi:hypothetical protein
MEKESVVDPPMGMLPTPKFLAMTAGEMTVREALEVLPVPPCVAETCTGLFFTPEVVPVTLIEKVQEDESAIVPADKETVEDPATADAVPEQVLTKLLDVATINPEGRVSVKATPVNASLEFEFVMVKVREVEAFRTIVAAPKAWLIDAELATVSVKVCVESDPMPLWAVMVRT